MNIQGYMLSVVFIISSLIIVILCHYKPKYYKEILSKRKVTDEKKFIEKSKISAKRMGLFGIITLVITPFLNNWITSELMLYYLYFTMGIIGFAIAFKHTNDKPSQN